MPSTLRGGGFFFYALLRQERWRVETLSALGRDNVWVEGTYGLNSRLIYFCLLFLCLKYARVGVIAEVSLEAVTVSTEGLQVRRVIVPPVTVNVVHVELTDMDWLEVAVLAVILFMYCVRIDKFIVGFDVDCFALVA